MGSLGSSPNSRGSAAPNKTPQNWRARLEFGRISMLRARNLIPNTIPATSNIVFLSTIPARGTESRPIRAQSADFGEDFRAALPANFVPLHGDFPIDLD